MEFPFSLPEQPEVPSFPDPSSSLGAQIADRLREEAERHGADTFVRPSGRTIRNLNRQSRSIE